MMRMLEATVFASKDGRSRGLRRMAFVTGWAFGCIGFGPLQTSAALVSASPPSGVTLILRDDGSAVIGERRQFNLAAGMNEVRFSHMPDTLVPESLLYTLQGGDKGLRLQQQVFRDDTSNVDALWAMLADRPVVASTDAGSVTGEWVGAVADDDRTVLALRPNGSGDLTLLNEDRLASLTFPHASTSVFLRPTLVWLMASDRDRPVAARLHYQAEGLHWQAAYTLILAPDRRQGTLSARVAMHNRSGIAFEQARVRLTAAARQPAAGRGPSLAELRRKRLGREPFQFRVGADRPMEAVDETTAETPLVYDVQEAVDLPSDGSAYAQLAHAPRLPVLQERVYDGVRFDGFPRNPRVDWNIGTESQPAVEVYLRFENTEANGLGVPLPFGRLMLFNELEDGSLDWVGESFLPATPVGGEGWVRLSPVPGLHGRRVRTDYREIVPRHEYEESFDVLLMNDGTEPAVIRVVEHLYRGSEYEIVAADAPFEETGPQTIAFHVQVDAGARKTVHYTVRYRW